MFSTTRKGNPVLIMGSNRYNLTTGYSGHKLRWACTKKMIGLPVFSTTRYGNPVLILGSNRYNLNPGYRSGPKLRFACTKKMTGCKAIVYTLDNVIVEYKRSHNHR
ncbi:hypothetical protein B5X24_HaOG203945 [Helicoverpa armigera]|uniref:FLYWCH-type domain-containing protein n=1 Tax=Helicoverpa armigera TaxID=29058 RepID=A0A2W1BTN6_HELAM|nr:hypothetical protein B5X24_HaOG203945 [Helicoverpa armigera]